MRRVRGVVLVAILVTAGATSCATTGSSVRAGRSTQRTTPTDAPSPTVSDTSPATTDAPADTTSTSGHQRGIGDPLFPDLGNPGLDVTHYEVDLTYEPSTHALRATVALSIAATADLVDFSLDSIGPKVDSILLDGTSASFSAQGPELVITPTSTIKSGTAFVTTVAYSLSPDPAGSPVGIDNGWFPTDTGSYVVNEPDGARTWLPSDDHPSDKATFRFTLHVPTGLTGVANGVLESHTTAPTGETWVWNQTEQMATYLVQVLTGPYDIIDGVGPNGLPLSSVVLHADHALMQPFVDATAAQIEYFEGFFGPYPLKSYGIAMTDSSSGLAMEEQGRSLFSRDDFLSGRLGDTEQLLLSHELAHQWFGDAVTPATWQDVWLNETFATYGEWMWLEHIGAKKLADRANEELAQRHGADSGSTGRPRVEDLFGYQVYDGGAVVLQALRLSIGDTAFFQLLQTWVKNNVGTSRTTKDFIALANQVSGIDLTKFFNDWLYATDLPQQFPTCATAACV
jgi:aminopeptidase N